MTKQVKIGIIVTVVAILCMAVWFFGTDKSSNDTYIVKRGRLESVISCKGEVQGEKATLIELAPALCDRELQIWNLKITDLIAEGKQVKKGDYIARLDESVIMNPMRDNMKQKEKVDSDLRNAKIDSAVVLTQKRENITNSLLDLEYIRIDLEQSKYESGAYQRKAKMSFEKAELELQRKKRDYLLEKNKQKIQVMRMEEQVSKYARKIKKYQDAMQAATITSPGDGIIMFGKDWMGKKLKKESQVSMWNPLIATLPDMSVANSETYIKEIDISKINKGDSVRIAIDAVADRQFSGKITHIATIGESHKDFDMKVFKVLIRFDQSDKDLKPGMTCNNEIVLSTEKNALIVPLNAVFTENKASFVYLQNGNELVKQAVKTGADDETNIVILDGLKEGDKIATKQPDKEIVSTI